MTTSKYIFISITILIIITSCIKDIKIDSKEFSPIPVLTSFLDPSNLVTAHLYFSTPITDKDFPFIEDATVALYEDDVFIENLIYQGEGRYQSNSTYPVIERAYKIVCTIPDYGIISGKDRVPKFNVNIETEYDRFAYTDKYGDFLPSLKLELKDNNKNQADFYDLFWVQKEDQSARRYYYRHSIERADPIVTAESIIEYNPLTIPVSDELFDGQSTNLEIVYSSLVYFDSIQYSPLPNLQNVGTYLHFRQLSENHYKFLKSWYRHLYNQATEDRIGFYQTLLFGEEPIELYSNIENGLGIVATSRNRLIKID